jgi:nitrite reductase/ring-hydroxylating ferredoxin subunit
MTEYRVADFDEIPAGKCKVVSLNGVEYGIFNVNGEFHAYRNVCPHEGAKVCAGTICGTRLPSKVYEYKYGRDKEILRCPWHGWEFDLKTGEHLVDPETRLRRGKVECRRAKSENLERGQLETRDDGIYLIL